MKKEKLVVQITVFVLLSSALGGMFVFTDVYDEVFVRIVSVTCLSCIKLDPITSLDFTFKTANNKPHPNFIKDNLTKGPVFLAFRTDVCDYCDDMEPLLQDIFDVEYEKEDVFYQTIDFNGTDVTFIHINTDWASDELRASQGIYDKDLIDGVPMFTIVTINYDHDGYVKEYYTSAYGILNRDYTDEKRIEILTNLIQDGINLYNENKAGYLPD